VQSVHKTTDKQLKVWDKIYIYVGEGRERGEYVARIEDFINGGIIIAQPEFVKGKTLLREGIDITVSFVRDDAAYQFSSRIMHRTVKGGQQMILSPPARIRRMQRRLFCRIETSTRVSFAIIRAMKDWDDWEEGLTWMKSRCIDISGGGAMVRVQEKLAVGTPLLVRLEFFQNHSLPNEIVAVCRRSFLRDDNQYAGLEFILADQLHEVVKRDILERLPDSVRHFGSIAQNKLVSCIFAEQVELRKKGLL